MHLPGLRELGGLALLALLPLSASASETIRYSAAGFEAPTFSPGPFAGSTLWNGQDGWLVTGDLTSAPDLSKFVVQNQVVRSGSQAISIDATNQPTPYAHLRRNEVFTVSASEPLLDIRFDMYIANAVSARSEWGLQAQGGPGPGSGILEWWIDTNDVLHLTDGVSGDTDTGFVVTRDQWHSVVTRVDYNAKTVSVSFDGVLRGTVAGFSGIDWWAYAFASLMFIQPGDDRMYIDNFVVLTHDGSGTPFTSFCAGDGSATACPCGNSGQSGEGCANSSGAGAQLSGSGTSSLSADDLGFDVSGLPASVPCLLYFGDGQANAGQGTLFGDGLRCASGNLRRAGVRVADAAGSAQWGPGLASSFGLGVGDVRYFQAWYRDPAASPCGGGFNLSNGVEALMTP